MANFRVAKRFSHEILLTLLLLVSPLAAADFSVGQRIELNATNPLGVPLHRQSQPSLFDRAPDGSTAVIQAVNEDQRWLQIELEDSDKTGWIVRRYVARVLDTPPEGDGGSDTVSEAERAVWAAAESCEQQVANGERMAPRQADALRVATWNIRWFPDGSPSRDSNDVEPTHLAWLSCVLTWMNVDVVTLQEIRASPAAQAALEAVLDGINGLTGEVWASDLQACGAANNQHVGFIWNTERVALTNVADLFQFNGRADSAGEACLDNLRPGRYAYVESRRQEGADFHIISVHLDSGKDEKSHTTRATVYERIDEVASVLATADTDVMIIGDFNTMGRDADSDSPAESAESERQRVKQKLANEQPSFHVLASTPACTEYFVEDGVPQSGTLDYIVVATDMAEVDTAAQTRVTSYCAVAGCGPLTGVLPAAFRQLSDHCPVVTSLIDRDED